MKQGLVLLTTTTLAAVLLGIAAAGAESHPKTVPSGPMTYAQAVAAGVTMPLDKALALAQLPLCPNPAGTSGGYPTAAALDQAIKNSPEAPTCMADPRLATFSASDHPFAPSLPMAAATHSSVFNADAKMPQRMHVTQTYQSPYFYMGYDGNTSTARQGSQVNCLVTNPSLNTSTEHVECNASSLYPYYTTSYNAWVTVGWNKGVTDNIDTTSSKIYTEDYNSYVSPHYNAIVWTAYPLTAGQYYSFRARDYYLGGGQDQIIADMYWNGGWVELTNAANPYGYCYNPGDGSSWCTPENDVEVYSTNCQNGGGCPYFNSYGIDHNYDYVRTGPGVWQLNAPSTNPNPAVGNSPPYTLCPVSSYYQFYGVDPVVGHC